MNRQQRRFEQREERRQKKAGGGATRTARRPPGAGAARTGPPEKRERTSPRQFLHEVRQELNKVSWPDRHTLVTYTTVSLITTVVLTLYTAGLDYSFQKAFVDFLLGS